VALRETFEQTFNASLLEGPDPLNDEAALQTVGI
jgi:hypothetical protein